MKLSHEEPITQVVQAVSSSPRYAMIHSGVINHIASVEIPKHIKIKDAIKATKNKLHQVAGAYLLGEMNYADWLLKLKTARDANDKAELRLVYRSILRHHASTRERLDYLDQFYKAIFACLPTIHSLIDVACGLNPIAIPWMDLPRDVEYIAYDIYQDMIQFINQYFELFSIRGRAETANVIEMSDLPQADLALVLKTIPCLEQIDRTAGRRLLDKLNTEFMIISYPARSLGGRNKGMTENYEAHFLDLIAGRNWNYQKINFPKEFVYIVQQS